MSDDAGLADLAAEWREALTAWAIPDEILAQAPVSPWVHPPKMFRMDLEPGHLPDTPSFAEAVAALGAGGSVLDVGCGGGRSSLPLGHLATHVTGVDAHEAMLEEFREAAGRLGIPCDTVLGRWPDVEALAPVADVVVCHHVAYNVGDIVPFLGALTTHARRRVVVEVTARHPQSSLDALWLRFWGLVRPTQPTGELLARVVGAMGYDPTVATSRRPPRRAAVDRAEQVAFVRQRLCLTPDRDADVDEALGADPALVLDEFVTIAWSPT
jgi:SAM-dependent methyltransferase